MEYYEDISSATDEKKITVGVFRFKKTFDTIENKLLLKN